MPFATAQRDLWNTACSWLRLQPQRQPRRQPRRCDSPARKGPV